MSATTRGFSGVFGAEAFFSIFAGELEGGFKVRVGIANHQKEFNECPALHFVYQIRLNVVATEIYFCEMRESIFNLVTGILKQAAATRESASEATILVLNRSDDQCCTCRVRRCL